MKKVDLGQWIQILANLAVLTGIVFLALEARQLTISTQLAAAESYRATMKEMNLLVATNPDLAELIRRRSNGEELAGVDGFRTFLVYMVVFDEFENAFFLLQDGILNDRYLQRLRQSINAMLLRDQGMQRAWQRSKGGRHPDFVAFVDLVLEGTDAQ